MRVSSRKWTISCPCRWISGPWKRDTRVSSRGSRASDGPERQAKTRNDPLDILSAARSGLRSRFDDFRRAFERRDEAAYRVALHDFQRELFRWTAAEERVLLPAIVRVGIPGRDPNRELKLEYVQLRELTRYLLEQISQNGPLADILGLVENLERRFSAHESEMEKVYYPAVATALTIEEMRGLNEALPPV